MFISPRQSSGEMMTQNDKQIRILVHSKSHLKYFTCKVKTNNRKKKKSKSEMVITKVETCSLPHCFFTLTYKVMVMLYITESDSCSLWSAATVAETCRRCTLKKRFKQKWKLVKRFIFNVTSCTFQCVM